MNNSLEVSPTLIATKITRRRKKKRAADLTSSALCVDPYLEDLVRLRVAQIHECEWSMHEQIKKMKARGERTIRLGLLKEWRTQMIFSDREKAALNLAEVITADSISGIPYEAVHVAYHIFTEEEILCLVLAILAINDWHYLSSSLALCQAAKSVSRAKSTLP